MKASDVRCRTSGMLLTGPARPLSPWQPRYPIICDRTDPEAPHALVPVQKVRPATRLVADPTLCQGRVVHENLA